LQQATLATSTSAACHGSLRHGLGRRRSGRNVIFRGTNRTRRGWTVVCSRLWCQQTLMMSIGSSVQSDFLHSAAKH